MNTINISDCAMLLIDVQEKLVNMLKDKGVKENSIKLAKAAKILEIPTIITEQYPKGLGDTISEIKDELTNAIYIEKTNFSALKEPNMVETIKKLNKKQIIIFGIETHICVLQTAFDLINEGFEVFTVICASGSRNNFDKDIALKRLRHIGVQTVTTEMVLFELLQSSKHPKFKEVQSLIK